MPVRRRRFDLAALRALTREQLVGYLRQLSPSDLGELQARMVADEQDRREHPLKYARLWHQAPPRTSQRDAIRDLGELVTLVVGGNRTGKSEAGAQLGVATALGRHHPDVVAWCEANRVDPMLIPDHDGRKVWAISLDFGDSRRYLRPKYARYLPPSAKWRNREGPSEAEVTIACPDGSTAIIVFKAVDQGRDGFQGDAIDLGQFDEEPGDEEVVDEVLMRTVDFEGRIIITMTPLSGQTWLYHRWVKQPVEGVKVHALHGGDNPFVSTQALERRLANFGKHQQAARRLGQFTALEGRVYSEWNRDFHRVKSFPVPPHWPRFTVADWGTRNPTCILYLALDPQDDVVHVVAEWYQSGSTIPERAAAIRELERGGPEVELRWGDPEDASTNITLVVEHDLAIAPARKAVTAGVNAVAERLRLDATQRPHLVVHDCCANTIREIENLIWDPTASKRNEPDRPLKKDDHATDALRYGVVGINGIYGRSITAPKDEERDEAA